MTAEYTYYTAKGRSLEIAHEHIAKIDRHQAAWAEAMTEASAPALMVCGGAYVGLAVRPDGVIPDGWRKVKYGLVPAKSKAGKAITAKLEAAPAYDPARLTVDLIGAWGIEAPRPGGGLLVRYAGLERLGDAIVIRVPGSCANAPPDAEPLKASEYWRMKEALDAR